jgi:hypothetical protein
MIGSNAASARVLGGPSRIQQLLRENGLSLAVGALFVICLVGQTLTGMATLNQELSQHAAPTLGLAQYLSSGSFIEATFENWESEFLQMALFVVLTVKLRQKGSSESKPLDDEPHETDEDPAKHRGDRKAPGPVRRGGWQLEIYKHSLTLALFALFAVSFALHAYGGARNHNQEQLLHGDAPISTLGYITTSQFWFESFQNWQSEFLSVLAIVLLSIFLRQIGSPQSKPVAAPHAETGA